MKLKFPFGRRETAAPAPPPPLQATAESAPVPPLRHPVLSHLPTKSRALKALIDAGAPVETVLDIGVQYLTQELIDHFGKTPQILCEPVAEYHAPISRHYAHCGVDFDIEASAMSNMDGTVELDLSSVIDGLDVSHARMAEGDATGGSERRKVPCKRVDTLVRERGLSGPFLMKIDVDGAELLVLEGARDTLPKCSAVVIEAEIRNLFERAAPIMDAGLELFEIVDFCYYGDRLSQVDLVFANPRFFAPGALGAVREAFDFSKWVDLTRVAEDG